MNWLCWVRWTREENEAELDAALNAFGQMDADRLAAASLARAALINGRPPSEILKARIDVAINDWVPTRARKRARERRDDVRGTLCRQAAAL